MKMSNKGQLGDTTILIVSTIVIALMLVVFFFLIKSVTIGKSANEADVASLQEQNIASLRAYLDTKVNIQEQEMRMADLIRIASVNPNYENEAIAQTENIFNRVYSKWGFSTTTGLSAGEKIDKDTAASVDIQSFQGKITLFLGVPK
jgi:uncharacterized protein (UPF0333 family)